MRAASQARTRFHRTLQINGTEAGRRLWPHLRDRRLGGFTFVWQEPISLYIADFVCREARVIVEVGGRQHAENPRSGKGCLAGRVRRPRPALLEF
jgi:very-short-patch-repair endonuclease